MAALVVAEHDNSNLKPPTFNTVTAAAAIDSDVHVLVAGSGCDAAAEQASKIAGVSKVIVADDPRWGRPYIVDLQRVEQRFPPRQRWLVKDLAALLHSLPPNVSRTDQLRFPMVYLGKLRVDPLVRRWAGEIAAKQQRMARHTPKYP